ncbi:MAG: hypothetical protein ABS949_10755 [Solibacillus sp.]
MQHNKKENNREKKEEFTQDLSPDDLEFRDEQDMTKEQKDNSPKKGEQISKK